MALTFEWDSHKAAANEKKHGVGFKEATTVFGDPLGWFQADEVHSDVEERLLLLGRSSENRLLAVLFTDRGDELVRIISARLATTRERRKYEKDFR
ncbi:MAG TPA: BrnT family toxin [Gemmatimonadales bacterium]